MSDYERISEDHSEFQARRDNRGPAGDQVFGEPVLDLIERQNPRFEHRRNLWDSLRRQLAPVWQAQPAIASELWSAANKSFRTTDFDAITNPALADLLQANRERFNEGKEALRAEVERDQAEFREVAEQAIDRGQLPLAKSAFRRRLDANRLILLDRLTAAVCRRAEGGYGVSGYFMIEPEITAIAESLDPAWRRHVVFHELVHAISGRTLLKHRAWPGSSPFTGERPGYRMSTQRLGLFFPGLEQPPTTLGAPGGRAPNHFWWLNEGETEEQALRLSGFEGLAGRPAERQLRELILVAGRFEIPPRLLSAAFFEDYDLRLPAGRRVPAWQQFNRACNAAHDPRFLINLDREIAAAGGDLSLPRRRLGAVVLERDADLNTPDGRIDFLYGAERVVHPFYAMQRIREIYGLDRRAIAKVVGGSVGTIAKREASAFTVKPHNLGKATTRVARLRHHIAHLERHGMPLPEIAQRIRLLPKRFRQIPLSAASRDRRPTLQPDEARDAA